MTMIKWKTKIGGYAPIQAEGYFKDHYFYFRSRWDKATIEFAETEKDWEEGKIKAVYLLLKTDSPCDASWLPTWICRILIWKGCLKFLCNGKSNT